MKRPTCLFFALLFLASCDEPRQRGAEVVPLLDEASVPATATAVDPPADAPAETALSVGGPVGSEPEKDASATAEADLDLPPVDAELSVAMVGKKILVSGALRSRLQVERILEDLARDFPDHEVESDLRVEYHRHPVGWANRISAALFPDYLQAIEDSRISYRDGVVTLEGRAPDEKTLRELTEIAIEAFAGGDTRDLENKIVVK